MSVWFLFFFFSSRRRHTRYIGDWSSDVCSSDLRAPFERRHLRTEPRPDERRRAGRVHLLASSAVSGVRSRRRLALLVARAEVGQIGRASCRERGWGAGGGGGGIGRAVNERWMWR